MAAVLYVVRDYDNVMVSDECRWCYMPARCRYDYDEGSDAIIFAEIVNVLKIHKNVKCVMLCSN